MLQQIGVTRADISFLHAATDRNSNLRLQAATGSVINITLTRGALNGGMPVESAPSSPCPSGPSALEASEDDATAPDDAGRQP